MGYESKFYFVEHNKDYSKNEKGQYFGRVVAMVDMCNFCGDPTRDNAYNWTEVKGDLLLGEDYEVVKYGKELVAESAYTREDRYGSPIKFCSLENFSSWLVEKMNDTDIRNYWRTNLLKSTVDAFRLSGNKSIVVVHYGY